MCLLNPQRLPHNILRRTRLPSTPLFCPVADYNLFDFLLVVHFFPPYGQSHPLCFHHCNLSSFIDTITNTTLRTPILPSLLLCNHRQSGRALITFSTSAPLTLSIILY